MESEAEEGFHLLGGDRVAGAQSVDPGQAGAGPRAGGFAAGGVVRRQPDVAFVGGIQRGDLPGQVVIPRPGGQLLDAHHHTNRRHPDRLRYQRQTGMPRMHEVEVGIVRICRAT